MSCKTFRNKCGFTHSFRHNRREYCTSKINRADIYYQLRYKRSWMKCYRCWFRKNLPICDTAYTALKYLTRPSTILFPSKASLIILFNDSGRPIRFFPFRGILCVVCIVLSKVELYSHFSQIALGVRKTFEKINFNDSYFIRSEFYIG